MGFPMLCSGVSLIAESSFVLGWHLASQVKVGCVVGVRTHVETFPSSQTLVEGNQDAVICHRLDLNVKFRFGHFWLS